MLESLLQLYQKEAPTQLFYCYEILKNTYFQEHLRMAAFELTLESACLEPCFWTVPYKTILIR